MRVLPTNVLSYQLREQFLYILTSQHTLSIYQLDQICQECIYSYNDYNDVRNLQISAEVLWSRELSWPALQHNVLSLPRFQVETSRVIVLTTTDRQEDLMLLITMEYDHKRNRKLTEEKLDILQGEVNEIVEETLQEITENIPPETAADNLHDTPETAADNIHDTPETAADNFHDTP